MVWFGCVFDVDVDVVRRFSEEHAEEGKSKANKEAGGEDRSSRDNGTGDSTVLEADDGTGALSGGLGDLGDLAAAASDGLFLDEPLDVLSARGRGERSLLPNKTKTKTKKKRSEKEEKKKRKRGRDDKQCSGESKWKWG